MLHLTRSTVAVGNGWGDAEGTIKRRGLEHRADSATRDVPAPPALVALLDQHIAEDKPAKDGRLFVTRRGPGGRFVPTLGQPIPSNTYGKAWRDAREALSHPRRYAHRWPGARTTSGMPPCRFG